MAWLDPPPVIDEAPVSEKPSSSKKRPPRLPGAKKTLPPMPVGSTVPPPPRKQTMEVEMQWVELVDEPKPAAPEETTKPKRVSKRPIPREE